MHGPRKFRSKNPSSFRRASTLVFNLGRSDALYYTNVQEDALLLDQNPATTPVETSRGELVHPNNQVLACAGASSLFAAGEQVKNFARRHLPTTAYLLVRRWVVQRTTLGKNKNTGIYLLADEVTKRALSLLRTPSSIF